MPNQPQKADNYCPNCKTPADLDAKFCKNCGKSFLIDERRDLKEKIIEFAPSLNVTLISVILSLTLGYLLLTIKDRISNMQAVGNYDLIWVFLIVATFEMIVATWAEYMKGNSIFRWVPTYWDVVYPFFVGLTQSLAIFAIDFQNASLWYFSMGSVHILGFFEFHHMFDQARKSGSNRLGLEFYEKQKVPQRTQAGTLFFAALLFLFGSLEYVWKINSLFFAAIAVVLIFIILILGGHEWKRMTEVYKQEAIHSEP